MALVGDTGLRTPSVYEVLSSYALLLGRYDAPPVSALVDLVTSDLETGDESPA